MNPKDKAMNTIEVYNARLHNLRNIRVSIPKNRFIVVTGVSGSGKSSFIFDTLHKEGQRVYLEASGIGSDSFGFDSFDYIEGLSPTIAARQRTVSSINPRSVVGTTTRLLNLLANVYAQEGVSASDPGRGRGREDRLPGMFMFNSPHGACPQCDGRGVVTEIHFGHLWPDASASLEQWHDLAYRFPNKTKEAKAYIAGRLDNFAAAYGCSPDTPFSALSEEARSVFLTYRPRRTQSKKDKPLIFYGVEVVIEEKIKKIDFKRFPELQIKRACPSCQGYRVSRQAFDIRLENRHIGELCLMDVLELKEFIARYQASRTGSPFTNHILQEMVRKLECLETVGLSHLNLYRETPTLSGGEAQRLHIMSHLTAKMNSIVYIFDEPTAGLHETEKAKLIESFLRLKEQGNTVIVVEHDESVIRRAEHIIDFGPMAGKLGGEIRYEGDYEGFAKCDKSLTAAYLKQKSPPDKSYRFVRGEASPKLTIRNARTHNLKNVTADIPLNAIVGVCGVSGSGKSSLIAGSLLPGLQALLREKAATREDERDDEEREDDLVLPQAVIEGVEHLDGCCVVTQRLARRFESSCVATYLGVWDGIRKMFAAQDEALEQGFDAGFFSFNSTGSCPACSGSGIVKRWLGSLPVQDRCNACEGKRFKREVLEIRCNGYTIADYLAMSVSEALVALNEFPRIRKLLGTIEDLGMGYMGLGQSLTTLSGGEAQRLKLAKELGKNTKGRILYVLDEPTVGLSYYDAEKLLVLLNRLVADNHSVLVIEHDPYVLSYCDYLIEMGPEGGPKGGFIVSEGTPEELRMQAQLPIAHEAVSDADRMEGNTR